MKDGGTGRGKYYLRLSISYEKGERSSGEKEKDDEKDIQKLQIRSVGKIVRGDELSQWDGRLVGSQPALPPKEYNDEIGAWGRAKKEKSERFFDVRGPLNDCPEEGGILEKGDEKITREEKGRTRKQVSHLGEILRGTVKARGND